jgi:hypothetical protein
MSLLTTKEQSSKFESKTPRSTAKRPKKLRKAQEGYLGTNKRHEKRQTKEKSKEKLKIRKPNTPPEINFP